MDIMISPENFRIMEDDLANRGMFSDGSDPVYVRATVKFSHHTWWHVGIRYKGQSTLFQTKMSGNHKYPFHLNFNKFDTDYPEIKNQNFYGFKELLCNNCWFDASFIRDAVVSDVFRDAGIPTARCSFCRMYLMRCVKQCAKLSMKR
jgi:spore coat protein H